jgi:hypothetical protein
MKVSLPSTSISLPPSLTHSLTQGFDLAEMDSQLFGGGSDPYLVVSADPNEVNPHPPPSSNLDSLILSEILRGDKLRTKVISHNLNPVWSDAIEFKSLPPSPCCSSLSSSLSILAD